MLKDEIIPFLACRIKKTKRVDTKQNPRTEDSFTTKELENTKNKFK